MKVVVACPVGRKRDYSLARWAEATQDYDRMVAIDDWDYAARVHDMGLHVVRFPLATPWIPTHFNNAWRVLIAAAQEYDYILSLESDIIAPPDIVEVMFANHEADFTCHGYPFRPPRVGTCHEMGCTLAERKTWEKAVETTPAGVALYDWFRLGGKFTVNDIDVVELEHLTPEPFPTNGGQGGGIWLTK